MKTTTFCTFFFALFLSIPAIAQNEDFKHNLEDEKLPWTDKGFFNNPDNFQFAIVSDRTGGHRPGVFGKALEKINMLYPEFVMSVGDLIEGYTQDTTQLNYEWKEFHGILDSLNTKFFYVAGNHDYTNPVMADMWKEKIGPDYYHFIYKDVLFLIANSSNGNGGVMMSPDQIAYLKEVIAQNTDVRWTMLFLHHPMWSYGDINGYDEVEAALAGRDYTVFAGHTHRYMFEVRQDANHYLLGTTGGGSSLRGPSFGEFDHISWVTMTDEGPKFANLELSGILKDDVSTRASREEAAKLIDASRIKPLVLSKGNKHRITLPLVNDSDRDLHYKARLFHSHDVVYDRSEFEVKVPARSTQHITINTESKRSDTILPSMEIQWQMGYATGFMEPEFMLNGTEIVDLSPSDLNTQISFPGRDIFLDDYQVTIEHPYGEGAELRYTTDGSEPVASSPLFPEGLKLDKTTNLRVRFQSPDGYTSETNGKTFRKVKQMRSVRLRRPKQGMKFKYYEGNFKMLPDFDQLGKPLKTGVTPVPNPIKNRMRPDHYAIRYEGYIQVPEDGIYYFSLRSDDGSKLYIHDQLIIDNDGSHSTRTIREYAALKKGWHPVRIDYFEDYDGERLSLWFSKEGERLKPGEFWHR